MIDPDILKKHFDGTATADDWTALVRYPEPRPPIRLPKSETGLPANILDVCYAVSLEFGTMEYIEVQGNTDDEVREDDSIMISTAQESDAQLWADYAADLPPKAVEAMRQYVRDSMKDEGSRLYALMKQRRAEWETDCAALRERRKED